jgi:hypothetical protein
LKVVNVLKLLKKTKDLILLVTFSKNKKSTHITKIIKIFNKITFISLFLKKINKKLGIRNNTNENFVKKKLIIKTTDAKKYSFLENFSKSSL